MSKNGHSAFGVAELFSFLKDQAHMEGLHVKDAVAAGLVDFWAGRDDGRAAEANVIPIKGTLPSVQVPHTPLLLLRRVGCVCVCVCAMARVRWCVCRY
jgi:hypothetical protein